MKYVVLGGCPRSGTSVLTQIINIPETVFCGMELYNRDDYSNFNDKLFSNAGFEQALAEKVSKNKLSEISYKSQLKKLQGADIIGDKHPLTFRFWQEIYNALNGDVRFIWIYRDLLSVKASFNVRFERVGDSWNIEAKKTLKYWADAAESIISSKKALETRVTVVNYNDLFLSNYNCFKKNVVDLLDELEFDYPDNHLDKVLKKMNKKMIELEGARSLEQVVLNEHEKGVEERYLSQLEQLKLQFSCTQ